jgi:hypothetical protein
VIQNRDIFESDYLTQHGLNLHAVLDIKSLPQEIRKKLEENYSDLAIFTQLILIGNGGQLFWSSLKKTGHTSKEPVDDFTVSLVSDWLKSLAPKIAGKIIYPPSCKLDLQKLGQLAGWHHRSPAYRAVILTDSEFDLTCNDGQESSPCKTCVDKPCATHCPGKAVAENSFDLNNCISYRQQKNSSCQTTCQSRISCPVAIEHQYTEEQIHYHYSRSLQAIMKYT